MNTAYGEYLDRQNGIYNGMRAIDLEVGFTEGLERDPGTEPQSAFLIAWRHPEHITEQVEDASVAIAGLCSAITFGRKNAHTTVSDFGLQPNLIITPSNPDHKATLDALSTAVRNGIDTTDGDIISGRGVHFGDLISNKKTVIATGQPTQANWRIGEAIKAASAELGINDGAGLKGSWGNHMTVNRFLENQPVDEAHAVADMIAQIPHFGRSVPTAIDVGYFHTDPKNGFVYTTSERFDLPK